MSTLPSKLQCSRGKAIDACKQRLTDVLEQSPAMAAFDIDAIMDTDSTTIIAIAVNAAGKSVEAVEAYRDYVVLTTGDKDSDLYRTTQAKYANGVTVDDVEDAFYALMMEDYHIDVVALPSLPLEYAYRHDALERLLRYASDPSIVWLYVDYILLTMLLTDKVDTRVTTALSNLVYNSPHNDFAMQWVDVRIQTRLVELKLFLYKGENSNG